MLHPSSLSSDPAFRGFPGQGTKISRTLTIANMQADSLTEEQVSEFKEAFSLFVSTLRPHLCYMRLICLGLQDKDGDGESELCYIPSLKLELPGP